MPAIPAGPPVLYALLALPLSASLEPAPGVIVHEVQTAIEIEARPDLVWPHVIAFRPIDEPRDWLFRMGIAYPQYAKIEAPGTRWRWDRNGTGSCSATI